MPGCVASTRKKYMSRPSPSYPANECQGEKKQGNDGFMYTSVSNKRGIYTWKRNSGTRKNSQRRNSMPSENKQVDQHKSNKWLWAAYHVDAFFKKGRKCTNWGEGSCIPELMRKIEKDIGWTEIDMKKVNDDTYSIGYVGMNESRDEGIQYLKKHFTGLENKGIISDFKLIPNDKLNK
jgi:CRISPR/Cas system CMR-associated protein Cmr1 (group 7 of RAMP superfamily)